MNQDIDGNRKLFWEEISNMNGGKMESCSRIKEGNGGLALGEDEVRRIRKDDFEGLYRIDNPEQVALQYVASMVVTSEES